MCRKSFLLQKSRMPISPQCKLYLQRCKWNFPEILSCSGCLLTTGLPQGSMSQHNARAYPRRSSLTETWTQRRTETKDCPLVPSAHARNTTGEITERSEEAHSPDQQLHQKQRQCQHWTVTSRCFCLMLQIYRQVQQGREGPPCCTHCYSILNLVQYNKVSK